MSLRWLTRRGLSRADCVVLAETVVGFISVEFGVRWLPPARLIAHLGRTRGDAAPPSRVIDSARAARLVEAASAFYPFGPTCLKKSLVLFQILRRRGIPAELRIGVRKVGDELHSHAWIECGGQVLIDRHPGHQYAMLPLESR